MLLTTAELVEKFCPDPEGQRSTFERLLRSWRVTGLLVPERDYTTRCVSDVDRTPVRVYSELRVGSLIIFNRSKIPMCALFFVHRYVKLPQQLSSR